MRAQNETAARACGTSEELAFSQPSQTAPSSRRAKRALVAALVVTALGCLPAPVAFAVDPPDFTVDPASPGVREPATFTPSNIPAGATVTWQYEADDAFVPETTHAFAKAGSYDVTMRVDDGGVVTDYPKTVVVHPNASLHRAPAGIPVAGEVVKFTSDSVPWSTETISSLKWDVDLDGFDDGTGAVLNYTFATPGNQIVRLEVVQSNGERDVAELSFRVNAPPRAGFVWTPGTPVAGGAVQLYSTSVDAEGALTSEAWDLDGDGAFDDAFGPSVTHTFSAGGYDVSLRVTDGDGVARTITRRITVAAPILPAAPPLMKPFPTVRLVGVVLPKGARITLVEVRSAPRGARVTVRCTGRGCPFSSRRRIAETGRVRLSNFTRVLVAGARIEVFVRAPKVIGRYVAWRIRAGKRPVRTDRCLLPGASAPTRCT
jgi:PKD repeat protein